MDFYKNKPLILTTMHQKEIAIKPAFEKGLEFFVETLSYDTDLLGTFTGEIPRRLSQVESAKEKALIGLKISNEKFSLGSEGSFGPHPYIPFAASDIETLYFIDLENGIELSQYHMSTKSNFHHDTFSHLEEMESFLKHVYFPSHALILKPHIFNGPFKCLKGINNFDDLKEAFTICKTSSEDARVFVQTDMRAHMNPTRMQVISETANLLAKRIACLCPVCNCPGFGFKEKKDKKICQDCSSPTTLALFEVHSCLKCSFSKDYLIDNNGFACPEFCLSCNP
jgi:hypothetical protein